MILNPGSNRLRLGQIRTRRTVSVSTGSRNRNRSLCSNLTQFQRTVAMVVTSDTSHTQVFWHRQLHFHTKMTSRGGLVV